MTKNTNTILPTIVVKSIQFFGFHSKDMNENIKYKKISGIKNAIKS